jgi:FkbM family methyltransferase
MSALRITKIIKPYLESKNRHGTYIDVGANVGLTTLPVVDYFDKIYCFEPNPVALEQMKNNLDVSLINVYPVALSNYIGSTDLIVPNNNTEHGTIVNERYKKWERNKRIKTQSYKVAVKTLDSYNFANVDFIKIDTEQSENEIIEGAMQTIKRDFPVIFMENKRSEAREAVQALSSLGYKHRTYKADMMFTKEIK